MSYTTSSNTDKRFGMLVLPYEMKDKSIAKELMVDYENGHLFVRDTTGTKIISITKELETRLDLLFNDGGNYIPVIDTNGETDILNNVIQNIMNYVNSTVQGMSSKTPARLCSEDNVAALRGIPTYLIDNTPVLEGDCILLIGQTDKKLNGKWIVSQGDWYRDKDLDEQSEIECCPFLFVTEGEKYKEKGFVLATDKPIIGQSDLEWQIFTRCDEIIPGYGITKVGNEISLEPISGLVPGRATRVRFDDRGRIISYDNPTTLEEYGITDAVSNSHVGSGGDAHAIATVDDHGFMSKESYIEQQTFVPLLEEVEQSLTEKIQTKAEVEFISEEYIDLDIGNRLTVADNLNTDDATKALSARQGFIIKQKLSELFTNNNEDSPEHFKIWVGTLGQYENLREIDSSTIYYINSNLSQLNSSKGSSEDDLLELIQSLEENKVSKDGDQMSGSLVVGAEDNAQSISLFGTFLLDGVDITKVFASIDHTHEGFYTKEQITKVLADKANAKHQHKISDIDNLEKTLKNLSSSDHEHKDTYYDKTQIDDKMAHRAPVNHDHELEDIKGLDKILSAAGIPLKLSDLKDDATHRTVSDAQIAKWNQGTGTGTGGVDNTSINTHNTSISSHTDIRQLISSIGQIVGDEPNIKKLSLSQAVNDLYERLPDASVKLNCRQISYMVDVANTTEIPLGFTNFNENIHTLLVFGNSAFVPPTDYTVENDIVTFSDPIEELNTIVNFVILWTDGNVVVSEDGNIIVPPPVGVDESVVETMIEEHNTGETSHTDLRTKISELENKIKENTIIPTTIDIQGIAGESRYTVDLPDYYAGKYIEIMTINGIVQEDYTLSSTVLVLTDTLEEDSDIRLKLYKISGTNTMNDELQLLKQEAAQSKKVIAAIVTKLSATETTENDSWETILQNLLASN